jgi:hypothetical protein
MSAAAARVERAEFRQARIRDRATGPEIDIAAIGSAVFVEDRGRDTAQTDRVLLVVDRVSPRPGPGDIVQ